jgi:ABC-type transport system involved in cytochrome c biogenesis ATPase subunit/GNAT superfamily N-acetyltransferase
MRKRNEYFRICRFVRRYDRASGKFLVNVAYETAAPRPSERVVAVAEGFGLGLDKWEKFVVYDNVELKVSPRDVVYITGDSGSGKSVLLRAIKEDLGEEAIDVAEVQIEEDRPLVETVGSSVEEAIELLSRVGLNDAFLFLRSYRQLSDGQKYRYRIAKLIESKKQWWLLDEFAATLDRDTAKIVAWNLQKAARALGKAVVAATTHQDLLQDLSPDLHVHKRFGKEIHVTYGTKDTYAHECSLLKEMRVQEGSTKDWRELASFHYRSHRLGAVREIFCLKRGEEVCGVIVYCYPPPSCFGRRMVAPKMDMKTLNKKFSIISRVVIHPKYRTIGLGEKMVRETLRLAGTECVEMSAVMAKYNPFAEKAGMRRVALQPPAKEAVRIMETLRMLGFNVQLLGSGQYVLAKLEGLNQYELAKIKDVFMRNKHQRFFKEFSSHLPYGKTEFYKREVEKANLGKLARLIKISSFLLQTKVYLFWSKTSNS